MLKLSQSIFFLFQFNFFCCLPVRFLFSDIPTIFEYFFFVVILYWDTKERHRKATLTSAMINAFLCEFNYFALIANIFWLRFSKLLNCTILIRLSHKKRQQQKSKKSFTIFLLFPRRSASNFSFYVIFIHNIIRQTWAEIKINSGTIYEIFYFTTFFLCKFVSIRLNFRARRMFNQSIIFVFFTNSKRIFLEILLTHQSVQNTEFPLDFYFGFSHFSD